MEKSLLKVQLIIYADLESLLNKIYTCDNNTDNSSTTKLTNPIPSAYSLFPCCSFLEKLL